MISGPGKCSKIRYIVQLHQMVRRWRQKAASRRCPVPPDVPSGHVAVTVGSSGRRFIVRATHLNHPIFRRLLVQAEEEYGFVNQWGPLAIPCDDRIFQDILCFLDRPDQSQSPPNRFVNLEDHQKNCHVSIPAVVAPSQVRLVKTAQTKRRRL